MEYQMPRGAAISILSFITIISFDMKQCISKFNRHTYV